MIDSVDSSKQKAGFRFTANLETNLQAEDVVVAPRGTTVYGQLAQASSAGTMKGSSQLTLELTDIVINGNSYPLLTSTFEIKGKGEGNETAKKVVGGAGLGALIGGIAGGGTGALIGLGQGRVPDFKGTIRIQLNTTAGIQSDVSVDRNFDGFFLEGPEVLQGPGTMSLYAAYPNISSE
jgi:alanine dehydrogenase